MRFRIPLTAWNDMGMDFEPHNSHFLSQLESQESIDIPLDQKVSFKVILLKKDLFQKLDEMDDQFMPSKEANIRLFQRKDQPNATPLGCDLGNLKIGSHCDQCYRNRNGVSKCSITFTCSCHHSTLIGKSLLALIKLFFGN